jgi:hypothetical protein
MLLYFPLLTSFGDGSPDQVRCVNVSIDTGSRLSDVLAMPDLFFVSNLSN